MEWSHVVQKYFLESDIYIIFYIELLTLLLAHFVTVHAVDSPEWNLVPTASR